MSMHTRQCYPNEDKANSHYKAETMGKMDMENEAQLTTSIKIEYQK
jgi:hypothetical protein